MNEVNNELSQATDEVPLMRLNKELEYFKPLPVPTKYIGLKVNIIENSDSRMGGDEFVLILENVKTIEEIKIVCNRIIAAVEMPIELDGLGTKAVVTSSIGISLLNFDGIAAEELISNSDKAMYIAKNNGKNQFAFHSKQYKL